MRSAEERECGKVKAVMQEIHSLHVGRRPDICRDTGDCCPREVFMNQVEQGVLTVAEEEGRVVGLLSFFEKNISAPVLILRKVLYVDTVGVLSEFRRKGIGHALVENIRKFAEARAMK